MRDISKRTTISKKQMICPVCGSKNSKVLFSQRDKRTTMSKVFWVFSCDQCKSEFIDPPKNLSDYYKADYYPDYDEKSLLFRVKEYVIKKKYNPSNLFQRILFPFGGKLISALPSKPGRILDFGCSGGEILYMLKASGFDVYGMDISPDALKKCKGHGINKLKIGTEKDLSKYPDKYFDSIRASHVIEHMIDPQEFIKLAKKKLKDGGELVMQTPNINSFGRLFGKYSKYYFDIPRHTILFSNSSLLYLLEKNGFIKTRISYINFFGDQADNVLYYLNENSKILHRILSNKIMNLLLRVLLIPLEIILTISKQSQTMTTYSKIGNKGDYVSVWSEDNILNKSRKSLHKNGFLKTLMMSGSYVSRIITYICHPLLKFFYKNYNKTFNFLDKNLIYCTDRFNLSFRNERTIEIPIVESYLYGINSNQKVLEVGNVLKHYKSTSKGSWLVVDKYEVAPGVKNIDIVDFHPKTKFDLIFSISTIEHIGIEDGATSPHKAFDAIKHIVKECLARKGTFIFSIPIGFNKNLDLQIAENKKIITHKLYSRGIRTMFGKFGMDPQSKIFQKLSMGNHLLMQIIYMLVL